MFKCCVTLSIISRQGERSNEINFKEKDGVNKAAQEDED
jgi:hypothetical protein